jgi:hypothetical protein
MHWPRSAILELALQQFNEEFGVVGHDKPNQSVTQFANLKAMLPNTMITASPIVTAHNTTITPPMSINTSIMTPSPAMTPQ